MMLSSIAVALLAVVGWSNLDDAHRLGGRKVSQGYLQGKTVMICKDASNIERLEAIWDGFKTRPFVMIGSFEKAAPKATFPMYKGADISRIIPRGKIYIVDPAGKVKYKGDDERIATDVVVGLLATWEFPVNEKKWKMVMDWELMNLPAQAVVRYEESAKDFPEAAKAYEVPVRALQRIEGMRELVELVKFAHDNLEVLPKDAEDRKAIKAKVKAMIEKSAFLKQAKDEQVARAAKNAIADLTWYAAEI